MKDKKEHTNKVSLDQIKKSGFKKPKNYFNSFEDALFSKITEEKLPNTSGFKTPSKYFEDVERTILTKVSEEKKETKVISFVSRVKRIIPYTAAASVLLFVGLHYFSTQNTTIAFEDISSIEVENWLDTNYLSINTNELAEALNDDDFNDNDLINNITLNDSEIEDYLDDIDSSVLLNEIN